MFLMSLVDASLTPSATRSADDFESSVRVPRERTQSLNDVRAIVPESCYRRSAGRAAVALGQATVLYALPVVGLVLGIALVVQRRKPQMPVYGLTVIWALVGVIVKNSDTNLTVTVVAAAGIAIIAVALVVGQRRA